MAFCNSCGATLNEGNSFCAKCGAPVAAAAPRMSAASTGPAPAAPPPASGNSTLKTVLIIVGVVVVLGILCVAALTFVGLRIARHSRVTQDGDHVKVETPFGRVETSQDPEQTAKDIGVEIYPGAEVQKDGSSIASFGPVRTVTANFESSDSRDKVCKFYQAKFPSARVSTSDQNHCVIVSNDGHNLVTINVESSGDGSRFQINSVIKKDSSQDQ